MDVCVVEISLAWLTPRFISCWVWVTNIEFWERLGISSKRDVCSNNWNFIAFSKIESILCDWGSYHSRREQRSGLPDSTNSISRCLAEDFRTHVLLCWQGRMACITIKSAQTYEGGLCKVLVAWTPTQSKMNSDVLVTQLALHLLLLGDKKKKAK